MSRDTEVIEALTQALEYFEDRSDVVDGSYGEPAPNREMSLAQLCRDALDRVEPAVPSCSARPVDWRSMCHDGSELG